MVEKVIVLGAGGFLGRYICREFVQRDYCVVGIGRTSPDRGEVSSFIRGDLLKLDLPAIFRLENSRWLINAAGGASVGDSFVTPHRDWQKTVLVQARVLEALRQSESEALYLFLSSAAVYGEPTRLPVKEEMSCQPISPYGMHKWQAELLQEEYVRFFGLRGAILRIFSAYGEGLKRQVVYELSQKILQAKTQLEVYGTGEESRDFIHAADVARAVYCVATAEAKGVFNVASGTQTRIADLAKILVAQLRPGLPIVFSGSGKVGNPLKWQADTSKLQVLQFFCNQSIIGEQ